MPYTAFVGRFGASSISNSASVVTNRVDLLRMPQRHDPDDRGASAESEFGVENSAAGA